MKNRFGAGDGLNRIRNRGRAKNMPSIMPMIRLSRSINYKKRGICFRLFDLMNGDSFDCRTRKFIGALPRARGINLNNTDDFFTSV